MLYGELPEIDVNGAKLRGFSFKRVNPPKQAVLRLPSDAEMTARLDLQRNVVRSLGRRKSQTETIPNTKADLDLFNALRQDEGGEPFNEFEAADAVMKLTSNEVIDCEREGGLFKITLKTPFGNTVHYLAMPLAQDIHAYRRNIMVSTQLPHAQEEIRYRTDAATTLYDRAFQKCAGYLDDKVPPHHKFSVVVELVQAIDETDDGFNPNS